MTTRYLLTSLLLCAAAVTGSAATIVVNSVADENGATPPNANCTLREAVLSANDNVAVDACTAGEAFPVIDLINIPAGVFLLTLAETGDASGGSLDLAEDVDLIGLSSTATVLDGDGGQVVAAVLDVLVGVTVEVSNLWVRGGHSSFVGVENNGTMTLTGCRVAHNNGKGIGNWGTMTVSHSVISHNIGGTSGAGFYSHTTGDLTVVDSTVTNNVGIGISSLGTLHVNRTTVSGNQRLGITGYGGMEVLNSTISGNGVDPGAVGGGISINLDGIILINNSTITDNTAGYGSGLFVQPNALAQLQNTIVAGNHSSADCDVYGTVISTGGNIEGPGNSCGFTDPTDQVNVSAIGLALGPLLNHGGATKIHGLLPGSVAIDTGVSAGPVLGCPGEDQRGKLRTDGLCDVGSVEVQDGEDMTVLFADGFESGDTVAWGP
jgi:CSLREA domain-containing protein